MGILKDVSDIIKETAKLTVATRHPSQVVIVNERKQQLRDLGIIKIHWTEKINLVDNGEILLQVKDGKVNYKSFGFFKGEGTLRNEFVGSTSTNFTITLKKITKDIDRVIVPELNGYVRILID